MSGFLLDTNVISELVKAQPEPRVTAWIEATDESLIYLSVHHNLTLVTRNRREVVATGVPVFSPWEA